MTTIDLTKEQVEELKSFYKLELEKSFNRTNEILGILNKLEDKPESISKPIVREPEPKKKKVAAVKPESITKPIVQEPLPEKKIVAAVQKEGNKYVKWTDAIVELLTEKQKPLSSKEIETILVKQKNIPTSDLQKANYAIHQSLFRLRTKTKKIQTLKTAGQKALYGLSEWTTNTETEKSIEPQQNKTKQKKSLPIIDKDIKTQKSGKPNWQGFIKETLESKKRVLNLGELVNVALKHFELKSTEKTRTKANLAPVLTKLVKKDKILKTTQKKGVSGRSYGLKEWFDEKGNLVSIYK
jgi:hypothetical protein